MARKLLYSSPHPSVAPGWVLVTGGTGTIGEQLVTRLLAAHRRVRIFSRDESKQSEMAGRLGKLGFEPSRWRMFIGDVRDADRLERALDGVSTVYHLAALKHVDSCEYNPIEAIRTNIVGVENLVRLCPKAGVRAVVSTSSDKAAEPNNLMGATKLVGERLITQANAYGRGCRFMSIRFGNVLGSRGSVLPRWREEVRHGRTVSVTDPRMTRFVMSPQEAVDLVLWATGGAGGEVFVRDMPVVRLEDLAACAVRAWASEPVEIREVGPRPGETMHEKLITDEEVSRTVEVRGHYAILPNILFGHVDYSVYDKCPKLTAPYSSDRVEPLGRPVLQEWLKERGLL